jgi:hypothetical protein
LSSTIFPGTKQVLPEAAFADHLFEILVGGCHSPEIGLQGSRISERYEFTAFKDLQEIGLESGTCAADLIEKQSPPVGKHEAPRLAFHSPGKGASGMAEELRLKKGVKEGRRS